MHFEQLKLGATLSIGEVKIEPDKLKSFALEYDYIPLHTDEEYAKTTRFKGIIAPGIFTYATLWGKYLENNFCEDAVIAGMSTNISWSAPVYPNDVLSGEAKIIDLIDRDLTTGIVEISIEGFNQEGRKVISAVTKALVKKEKF